MCIDRNPINNQFHLFTWVEINTAVGGSMCSLFRLLSVVGKGKNLSDISRWNRAPPEGYGNKRNELWLEIIDANCHSAKESLPKWNGMEYVKQPICPIITRFRWIARPAEETHKNPPKLCKFAHLFWLRYEITTSECFAFSEFIAAKLKQLKTQKRSIKVFFISL